MSELLNSIILTVFSLLDFFLFCGSILGNAIVIFVISRDKKLKSKSNYHILSVAIADFLIALPGIPLSVIAGITGYPHSRQECLLLNSFLLAAFAVSMFSLVAVSVDRFWAVCDPVTYHVKSTTVTKIIILGCWICGIITGFLPFFGWNSGETNYRCDLRVVADFDYLLFVCVGIAFLSTVVIVILYCLIYRAILKQTKKRQEMVVYTTELLKQKNEIRATHTLALVVGSFLILWTPGIVSLFILAITKNREFDLDYLKLGTILVHLNSAIDPMIYACRMRSIRVALTDCCPILSCLTGPSIPQASTVSRQTMRSTISRTLTPPTTESQ